MLRSKFATFGVLISACAFSLPDTAHAQTGGALPPLADSGNDGDIVVTAQKRSERLLEVPASVSALTGDQLEERGVRGLQDFAALVPGLNVTNNTAANTVTIRGISNGSDSSSLTSIMLDGVPFGSTSSFAFGGLTGVDINPWDIQRVEVLRGPQSTLYGAAAMGGIVAYYTQTPSFDAVSGKGEIEGAVTPGGKGVYAGRAALNVPISSDLALRVSGSAEEQGGYIDSTATGQRNYNDLSRYGVRGSLLWDPAGPLRVRLNALYQKTDGDGFNTVPYDEASGRPVAGDLQTNLLHPDTVKQEVYQFSGVIDYDLGGTTLTSTTAFNRSRSAFDLDYTQTTLGSYLALIPGVASNDILVKTDVKKFSQELRLASNGSGPFSWIVGGFYTHEDATNDQYDTAYTADGTAIGTPGLTILLDSSLEEYSVFGNATYAFSPKFDVTLGARYSHNEQEFTETNGGLFFTYIVPQVAGTLPTQRTSESKWTFLANARYHWSDDGIVYARAASGYRPGGPNLALGSAAIPTSFSSDSLWNYEVGVKGRFARTGTFDVAAFYIDWDSIQLNGSYLGLGYFANGGSASSRGVEASASYRPVPNLSIGATITLMDAHLNEAVTLVGGADGERLPNSPRVQGSLSADYTTPLGGEWTGFAGASVRYMGRRRATYDGSTSPQFDLSDYALTDLRVGGRTGGVEITAYVNNLFDERAQYSAIVTRSVPLVSIARPRTIGVRFGFGF